MRAKMKTGREEKGDERERGEDKGNETERGTAPSQREREMGGLIKLRQRWSCPPAHRHQPRWPPRPTLAQPRTAGEAVKPLKRPATQRRALSRALRPTAGSPLGKPQVKK